MIIINFLLSNVTFTIFSQQYWTSDILLDGKKIYDYNPLNDLYIFFDKL